MAFDDLIQRVHERELALEQRHAHARASWRGLRNKWREGWSPTRIVLGGMLSGFLVGWARPMRKVTGLPASRWVQIGTSLWTLVASSKAKHAASTAEAAAGTAGVAAQTAAGTAEAAAATTNGAAAASGASPVPPPRPPPAEARRRADPQWEREPRPAEAATEISER